MAERLGLRAEISRERQPIKLVRHFDVFSHLLAASVCEAAEPGEKLDELGHFTTVFGARLVPALEAKIELLDLRKV